MASELAIDELVANHDEGIRDRLHIRMFPVAI